MNSVWYDIWVFFIWVFVPFLVYGHCEWRTFVKFLFVWIWFFLLIPPIEGSLAFGPLAILYSVFAYFSFLALTAAFAVPIFMVLKFLIRDRLEYLSAYARSNLIGIGAFLFSANIIAWVLIESSAWKNDFDCLSYYLPAISVPARTIHATGSKGQAIFIWSYATLKFEDSGATKNGPIYIQSACNSR
jgi:hypothetical protein